VLVSVLLLHPIARLTSQAHPVSRAQAVETLRSRLRIGVGDSMVLFEDSIPGVFPGVVFLRGEWDNHGGQVSSNRAAAVGIGDRWIVVAGPHDLPSLIALGGPFTNPARFTTVGPWLNLLQRTSLLSSDARVIRSRAEIGTRQQAWLTPKAALGRIRPPKTSGGGSSARAVFFVYDAGNVVMIEARVRNKTSFIVKMTHIATPILPSL